MNTIRYYRTISTSNIDENNYHDFSDSFIINCTGYENRYDAFQKCMPNGRKDNYFIYMQGGEMFVFYENGQKKVLSKGDCIFFEAGKYFSIKSKSLPVQYFWIHFTGSAIKNELSRFSVSHNTSFFIGDNAVITRIFHKIFDEFIMRNADFTYNTALYLLQILVEIKRTLLQKNNTKETRLKRSLQYINENHNIDIDIKYLASLEGICVSHYRDIFTKQMGVSPKQYITHQRISNACVLLSSGNLSIEEISQKCGYNDIRYFYRVFKKINGITPHQYRKLQNQ